jgi:hypothetical protein
MEYKNTMDFVTRMGVSTNGSMQFPLLNTKYIDFQTGKLVQNYSTPADADKYPALQKYLELCEKYENMLLPGFDNFPAPDAIPEDLLMPFGQFVAKYDIAAALPSMWQATLQGIGNFIEVPTMYVMQASGVPMVRALLGLGRAIVPPSGALYELYARISDFLGKDVFYSSTVVSSTRDNTGITVVVRGLDGTNTEIRAKRLVIAIEPTAANMQPFDLDREEAEVFDKFGYTTVYAGILRHPSLEVNTSYSHVAPAAAPANYTAYPLPSQLGRIDYLADTTNLFSFTAVGTDKDTPESMKKLMGDVIDKLISTGVVKSSAGPLEFPVFADHGMMHSRVRAEDVKGGFIQKQVALQGRRSTWYTGAAFGSPFSTTLWEYNEQLLPKVVEGN